VHTQTEEKRKIQELTEELGELHNYELHVTELIPKCYEGDQLKTIEM